MKSVDLGKEKVGLAQIIHFAEKEPVLLVAENGREFILSQADDFEAEVEALRNSHEFQAFLDRRMKSHVRIPIEDIEREVDRGGYGISWNDEIDLSESELWTFGKSVENIVK